MQDFTPQIHVSESDYASLTHNGDFIKPAVINKSLESQSLLISSTLPGSLFFVPRPEYIPYWLPCQTRYAGLLCDSEGCLGPQQFEVLFFFFGNSHLNYVV
jgi:hypothetical protein